MDSNVSRKTFFYKFFKLSSSATNLSLKQLLKAYLLEAIESFKLQQNLDLDLNNLSKTIANKIILLQSQAQKLSTKKVLPVGLSRLKLSGIVYRCAVAFPLTADCQLPPEIIAAKLISLLPSTPRKSVDSIDLKFVVRVVSPGWIDFYLSSEALALWLKRLILTWDRSTFPPIAISNCLVSSDDNLFFLQYVYARCISILRLAARERLMTLKDENFNCLTWCIFSPDKISWLDEDSKLWLAHPSEVYLLTQLLKSIDILADDESDKWLDAAFSLSEAMLTFDADCRIWGEVKQQTPELAIARLGLVALVQYLLQLLITKLGIQPLKEL